MVLNEKWSSPAVIKTTAREKCQELGYFPTLDEWISLGYGGMRMAMTRFGMSTHDLAIELGYQPTQKPKGYWKYFENIRKELSPLIERLDEKFPTQQMIFDNLGSSIINGIYRYHGGLVKVCEKMGYEIGSFHITSDGHYVDSSYEYRLDEYLYSRGIQHKVRHYISPEISNCQYDFKVNDYYIEIWGYEENKDSKIAKIYKEKKKKKLELYKQLKVKLISLESNVFKQKLEETDVFFDELFTLLGYDVSIKTQDYDVKNFLNHCFFWNETKIIEELKKEMQKHKLNNVPSINYLYEIGRNDLACAIKENYGIIHFRLKMGFGLHHKPDGYWTKERIKKDLEPIIEELGDFPSRKQLAEMDRHDLIRAMDGQGGFEKFQNIIGVKHRRRSKIKENRELLIECLKIDILKAKDKLGYTPNYEQYKEYDPIMAKIFVDRKVDYTSLIEGI